MGCRIALSDSDIRPVLINSILKKNAFAIEELKICDARADVVLVDNNSLHGFEIKSDRDKLTRLNKQVKYYSKIFSEVTLVVGKKHIDAISLVPNWWEVIVAEREQGNITLRKIRSGYKNLEQDINYLVELIWLDEARYLLKARNVINGFKRKPRKLVLKRVCELYSVSEITDFLCAQLRTRNWISRQLHKHIDNR